MSAMKTGEGSPLSALELLDMYYLDMRSALLEMAAGLDRVQAAQGGEGVMNDVRIQCILESCQLVGRPDGERARRLQEFLSEE